VQGFPLNEGIPLERGHQRGVPPKKTLFERIGVFSEFFVNFQLCQTFKEWIGWRWTWTICIWHF